MISLTDIFAVSEALSDLDLDVELRALIGFRAWHMCVEHECPIGTDVQIFVVQPDDTTQAINEALGFPITGSGAEAPAFLSIEDHGRWFELAYARDSDPHTRIFVENHPSTDFGIHAMCLAELSMGSARPQ